MPQELFPAEVPWKILTSMSAKVLNKQFDLNLATQATFVVGCCLTIAEKQNIPIPVVRPPMFQATDVEEPTSNLAQQLDDIVAENSGFAAPGDVPAFDADGKQLGMNPALIPVIIQIALQILSLIRR